VGNTSHHKIEGNVVVIKSTGSRRSNAAKLTFTNLDNGNGRSLTKMIAERRHSSNRWGKEHGDIERLETKKEC